MLADEIDETDEKNYRRCWLITLMTQMKYTTNGKCLLSASSV